MSQQNDLLKLQVDSLQKQNASLESRLQYIETLLKINPATTASLNNASLSQNVPNPFNGNTVISYTLPENTNTAQIVVYDMNGKTLKQVNITGKGKGSLTLDAAALAAGAYNYSLIVDGKFIDSKRMVQAK